MVHALSKFVAIPSVSQYPENREDCRQAAIWLKQCLSQLGARSSLVGIYARTAMLNTSLVAADRGWCQSTCARNLHRYTRIISKAKDPFLWVCFFIHVFDLALRFHSHYDVISAPPESWHSDPFTVKGKNGYLYGRGVNDNKGPILAIALAVANLLSHRALTVDLIFLVEGEEECGSTGFEKAVKNHKVPYYEDGFFC